MNTRRNGLAVLAIQLALVLSIGAKYAWERHHCPTVWTRANQFDPDQPLRGRYLALVFRANACSFPVGKETSDFIPFGDRPNAMRTTAAQEWRVVPGTRNGELVPEVVEDTRPGPTEQLTLDEGVPCQYATLHGTSDFFIPEHAKSPFPLKKGQELWALVTVPPSGPVRPVKLAVSDVSGFHVLNLD